MPTKSKRTFRNIVKFRNLHCRERQEFAQHFRIGKNFDLIFDNVFDFLV